jgi:hypothetical protein
VGRFGDGTRNRRAGDNLNLDVMVGMKSVISVMFVVGVCLPITPSPTAPCLTTQIATAAPEKTSTIPWFVLHPLHLPHRLNLCRYKGLSGIPKAEESTGKS